MGHQGYLLSIPKIIDSNQLALFLEHSLHTYFIRNIFLILEVLQSYRTLVKTKKN